MSLEILKKYSIKPKKSLGQNFLIKKEILEYISCFLNIKNKNILEIGPGYGALTKYLLDKKPRSLVIVEIDRYMVDILKLRVKNNELVTNGVDFEIKNEDVLDYKPVYKSISEKKYEYSVIANIPYYISSPILRHFLYNVKILPSNMIFLMQKDIVKKITRKNKSSVLSLFIAKKCFVKEVLPVAKENFIPIPKVESSLLFFEIHNNFSEVCDKKFLEIIKIGFLEPRKKLIKNLVKGGFNKEILLEIFKNIGILETCRAEDLDIKKWSDLTKLLFYT